MDNLNIYNKVRVVPQEAQKSFNNGRFSGTDINPMWRIKILTETFGPCGFGWYYEITDKRMEKGEKEISAFVDINLYVKVGDEWSKPIAGTGGNVFLQLTKNGTMYQSDECFKMALTDALSVASKSLGVGADIYFSNDKTKYTNPNTNQQQPTKATPFDFPLDQRKPLLDDLLNQTSKYTHQNIADYIKQCKWNDDGDFTKITDEQFGKMVTSLNKAIKGDN